MHNLFSISTALVRRAVMVCFGASLVVPLAQPQGVSAQSTLPSVAYDALNRTILVGTDYTASNANQAPYVEYPSHPNAPKQDITLAQIDAALSAKGQPDLITNTGTVWVLRTDMVVLATARLQVKSSYASDLQLDSTPTYPDGSQRILPLTKLVARGGSMVFDGIHLYAAENGQADTTYFGGRSYLLAENGGRMDVLRSEISHLGWSAGEPSGMSWRKMGKQNGDPTKLEDIRTGATGSVINSKIHDMYFGQYSYEAYGLVVKNSEFYNNILYGFDPHDYSTNFEIASNKVYNNGKHGIIFSRGCTLNRIYNNEVWGNKEHGIMLDRGSNVNQIYNNTVYNNSDGIALFQSEKNVVRDNTLYENERGVRINATYDQGDVFDGLANENVIVGNTIRDNTQYGIYLYERADKNVIEGNSIEGSSASGIYIKTGGNTIKANTIRTNDSGITILGGTPITVGQPNGTPPYTTPSYDGGHKNTIIGNTISDNNSNGIQLKNAVDTVIGLDGPNPKQTDGNVITTNAGHGISMDSETVTNASNTTSKNVIRGNTIHANGLDGVFLKGATTSKNLISRNSITANGRAGITLKDGANNGIPTPQITSPANATTIVGKVTPAPSSGAIVEVYRDNTGQGKVFLGTASVASTGTWSFALPANDNPQNGQITALLIDKYNNTSIFGGNAVSGSAVKYTVGAGNNGETTVYISGPGSNVTLPDIQRALAVISPTTPLLVEESSKVWVSNVSLFANRGVTITLTPDTVSWLKLASQGSDISFNAADAGQYNYKTFTTLRTYNGAILINGTAQQRITVSSWDAAAGTYDKDPHNGRSYLLAKYNARMDINYADIQYLGSADGESYGVAWRDINSSDQPDVLLTRVTGKVTNSTFSYNYYGIYTFQARDMTFQHNSFHHNIGYGFDPHDYSTNFVIEDNEAFENGNHGFIISRGCNGFQFRRNKSYNNHYTVSADDRRAHGFMLDPGSPNSRFAQVPSTNNLIEYNEAYGNDGYGLRIIGSNTNTIRNNVFTGNYQGITIEEGSTGNTITGNTLANNTLYGVYLFGGADKNTVNGNSVKANGKHGIYIKTGHNLIQNNQVADNGTVVDGVASGSGIATLRESDLSTAAADMTVPGTAIDTAAYAADTQAATPTDVDQNTITGNTVTNNADEGIELKHASATLVQNNTISASGSNGIYIANGTAETTVATNVLRDNGGYGIRANGEDVTGNTWNRNTIYTNRSGGIATTSDANNAIKAPVLTRTGNEVTGTTRPNATVELYSDDAGQGRIYELTVTADASGAFRATRSWKGAMVNAYVTDADGNSSAFAFNHPAGAGTSLLFLPLVRR